MGKSFPSPVFRRPLRETARISGQRGGGRAQARARRHVIDRRGPSHRTPEFGCGRPDRSRDTLGDHPKGCNTPEWPMLAKRSPEGMQPSMRSTAPWVCRGPLRASGVQSSVPLRRPDSARHRWASANGGRAWREGDDTITRCDATPGISRARAWRTEFHGTAARSSRRSHDRAKRDTPRGSVMDTRHSERIIEACGRKGGAKNTAQTLGPGAGW